MGDSVDNSYSLKRQVDNGNTRSDYVISKCPSKELLLTMQTHSSVGAFPEDMVAENKDSNDQRHEMFRHTSAKNRMLIQ